jgi:prepilin signal peptidase PulO-like enzyme (type II secretory pathway)
MLIAVTTSLVLGWILNYALIRLVGSKQIKYWLLPLILIVLGLIMASQSVYQTVPIYVLIGNLILIAILVLIAMGDFYTRFIFPITLITLLIMVVIMLALTAWFNLVVGVNGAERAVAVNHPAIKQANFMQLWSVSFLDSLVGMILMNSVFGLVYLTSRVIYRAEAFGLGDVLLAGVIGFTLGFRRSLVALPVSMIASLFGALVIICLNLGKNKNNLRQKYIAYAPFLCFGAIWVLVLPDVL